MNWHNGQINKLSGDLLEIVGGGYGVSHIVNYDNETATQCGQYPKDRQYEVILIDAPYMNGYDLVPECKKCIRSYTAAIAKLG
jgi:hypothetical protein